MILRDVRYFASELDEGRYANVLKLSEATIRTWHFTTGRDDDRYVTFLQLLETRWRSVCDISAITRDENRFYSNKWSHNKFPNNFDEIKAFYQMRREQGAYSERLVTNNDSCLKETYRDVWCKCNGIQKRCWFTSDPTNPFLERDLMISNSDWKNSINGSAIGYWK